MSQCLRSRKPGLDKTMSDAIAIDWRSLFEAINIPWRDTGANTSAGNVNIPCPFCGDDPSFHLSVSEDKQAYYCYRRPNQHSGRNVLRLFHALGISRSQALALLNAYQGEPTARQIAASRKPKPPDAGRWQFFKSVVDSPQQLAYLHKRGFPDPEFVAKLYDLRYAPLGMWSGRILIPIEEDGVVIGWTGRALSDKVVPKYLMSNETHKGCIYAPTIPHTRLITVEGPFDALKINVAMYGTGVAAAALLGKQINDRKLGRYLQLLQYVRRHDVCLDDGTSLTEALLLRRELALCLRNGYTGRLRYPHHVHDAGSMSLDAIRRWLGGQQL